MPGRKQLKYMFVLFATVSLLVLAGRQTVSQQIPPSQLVVGTCLGASPYSTIQSAVSAAPSGGTVLVCPGTYPEQVTITQPLTLKGVQVGGKDAAVITSPSGGVVQNASMLHTGIAVAAQVLVEDAKDVDITNLTVDGSGNKIPSCGTYTYLPAFYYQNASGTLENVATRNQIVTCGGGVGIYAETGGDETAEIAVLNSSFHSYDAGGIIANWPGLKAVIVGNSIAGIGVDDGRFENGIQIGHGATGKVEGNTVIDNIAPDGIGPDTGILIYAANRVIVENNTVGNTNYGITAASDPVSGAADHTTIKGNTVLATRFAVGFYGGDAIDVCSNSNRIEGNTVSASNQSGIHLDSTCISSGNNNVVKRNTINEACAAILVDTGTTGNAIVPDNHYFNDVNTVFHADTCTSAPVYSPLVATDRVAEAHSHFHVIP